VNKNNPQYLLSASCGLIGLLDFIACRVLRDKKRAQIAIHNCWQAAARNPPRFEFEGAFRSWLARVLIDEAFSSRAKERGMQPRLT